VATTNFQLQSPRMTEDRPSQNTSTEGGDSNQSKAVSKTSPKQNVQSAGGAMKAEGKTTIASLTDRLISMALVASDEDSDRDDNETNQSSSDQDMLLSASYESNSSVNLPDSSSFQALAPQPCMLSKPARSFSIPTNFNLQVALNYCVLTAKEADDILNNQNNRGCVRLFSNRPLLTIDQDFVSMVESSGKVLEFRSTVVLMNNNKHEVFVTFKSERIAKFAAKALDEKMISDGQVIRAQLMKSRIRLYVGNIPKSKTNQELMDWFKTNVPGVKHIYSFPPENDVRLKNRGFCFVEFVSPGAAHIGFNLLQAKLAFGRRLRVEWPSRRTETEGVSLAGVSTVHIRPLMKITPDRELLKVFKPYGIVTEVKRLRTYTFVEYLSHKSAVKAVKELNGKSLFGSTVEVALAIPLTNKKISHRAHQKQIQKPDSKKDVNTNKKKNKSRHEKPNFGLQQDLSQDFLWFMFRSFMKSNKTMAKALQKKNK